VARYQQMGAGMWLLCPCRSVSGRNAALVPVAQTHIPAARRRTVAKPRALLRFLPRSSRAASWEAMWGRLNGRSALRGGLGRQSKGWIGALSQTLTQIACENASNHDPTAKVTQSIDFVRKDEILPGSFFARNVTPSG
jgi:hypothetical protein